MASDIATNSAPRLKGAEAFEQAAVELRTVLSEDVDHLVAALKTAVFWQRDPKSIAEVCVKIRQLHYLRKGGPDAWQADWRTRAKAFDQEVGKAFGKAEDFLAILLAAVEVHRKDPEAVEQAAGALRTVLNDNVDARTLLAKYMKGELLVSVLRQYVAQAGPCSQLLGLVGNYAHYHARLLIRQPGLLGAIADVMEIHKDNVQLLTTACLAFNNLSVSTEWGLREMQNVERVCAALQILMSLVGEDAATSVEILSRSPRFQHLVIPRLDAYVSQIAWLCTQTRDKQEKHSLRWSFVELCGEGGIADMEARLHALLPRLPLDALSPPPPPSP